MAWREAKSLLTLLAQVNALYPNRDKASDGEVGDLRHQTEKSDHNPNAVGVVCALDVTNDPVNGIASRTLAEKLVASKDPRIKYIISNGQINSSLVSPWQWRPYHGPNGHFHHVHISVMPDPNLYDDTSPWNLGATVEPVHQIPAKPRDIKKGDVGEDVKVLQNALHLKVDGIFGLQTDVAVKTFQRENGLRDDGIVGQNTRKALGI